MTLIKSISGIRGTIGGDVGENLTPIDIVESISAYGTWLKSDFPNKKIKVVITTDHGSVRVDNPIKMVGERETTTNLRYKTGKKISYTAKEVFEVEKPNEALLPKQHVSSRYIFARENDFFVYPNNLNHYAKYYKDTFQHGGISLEEMLIPFVVLSAK